MRQRTRQNNGHWSLTKSNLSPTQSWNDFHSSAEKKQNIIDKAKLLTIGIDLTRLSKMLQLSLQAVSTTVDPFQPSAEASQVPSVTSQPVT